MRIGIFIILVIVAVLLAIRSHAMGWYPYSCCNENDCRVVPVTDVQIINGKYIVSWGGQTMEFYKANPSPDGQYHMCTKYGDLDGAIRELSPGAWKLYQNKDMPTSSACFWAPGGI